MLERGNLSLCRLAAVLLAVCALIYSGPTVAVETTAPVPVWFAALQQPIHNLLQQAAVNVLKEFPAEQAVHTEIRIGQPGQNSQVEPCQQIQPFLSGNKLAWGRFYVGLRCLDNETHWQVYVPVEVKYFGALLYTQRTAVTGEALQVEDVRADNAELSNYPLAFARQMLYNPDQIQQQILARTVATNQPLRSSDLKTRPTIANGDGVRVRMLGQGFTLTAQGKALQTAGEGQPVRVQIENGRILTGTARLNRQVEVQL